MPPWKIFILTVVGFGLMLAIAVHSRNEALNRLSQEYTITDDAKPRHIKFESMPVGEAEQAVGMYLRYNAMVQFEESGKILSDDLAKMFLLIVCRLILKWYLSTGRSGAWF